MTNRRAFTLLELIVSITVAGIVALLAYGSASAGFDTRDALARHRSATEAIARSRAVLSDALRHASDEADAGVPAFDLVNATDARGLPADRLTFLTRGILPPLGASALWTVTLQPSATGLELSAAPVDEAASARTASRLAEVRGLDVQVMALADLAWSTAWPSSAQLPAAVRLTFLDATGTPLGAPLVVRVGLEAVR